MNPNQQWLRTNSVLGCNPRRFKDQFYLSNTCFHFLNDTAPLNIVEADVGNVFL
jgi:hypothetical protein